MKNINSLGLFDDHFLMEKLTKLGDPLQKLNKFINYKIFESPINEVFKNKDRVLSRGGRPSFNRLILFKALIIAFISQCEHNVQYLSLYAIKKSGCHGIGMVRHERRNFVSI